ncbi:MAG: PaaI family thioesterase [Pararhodobacter sp.]
MPDNLIAPHIQTSFDRQSMMATFGATLVAAADGRAVIRAPLMPGVRQQHGAGHAALAFGIGDTAAGYAALSLMPAGREVMTAEIKINLLSPALGDWFEAVGEVVKTGRRLSVVRAEVVAITGATRKTIAILQGTMVPVDPAPE